MNILKIQRSIQGFTLIETIVVISIISILILTGFLQFNNIVRRSQYAQVRHDINQLTSGIQMLRRTDSRPLKDIINSECPECECWGAARLRDLPQSSSCWQSYITAINNINTAAGFIIFSEPLIDPWGSPYLLDLVNGRTIMPSGCDNLPEPTSIPPEGGCFNDYVQSAGPDGIIDLNNSSTLEDNINVALPSECENAYACWHNTNWEE